MNRYTIAKLLKVIICFIIVATNTCLAQWNIIYTATATTSSAFKIDYTLDSAIFVSSQKDFFYSKNNGSTFNTTTSFVTTPTVGIYNTNREFMAISFVNKDTGVIVGASMVSGTPTPFTQASTGTFSNWTLNHPIISTAQLSRMNSVNYFKNQSAYCFDNSTNIYFSADAGNSWILKNKIAVSGTGFAMHMINDQQGYFATYQGIYKTLDGGTTITQVTGIPFAYTYNIKRIWFRDLNNGYIIGSNSAAECKLYKTTNGGSTWQDMFPAKFPDNMVDVNFPTTDTGFIATTNYILQTFTGGNEWYIQRFPTIGFHDLDFTDKNHGVAVAQSGALNAKILKYTPNSISPYPFALFSFNTNYCCNGQVCSITNFGSLSWTYKWYVNNVLSSTAHTPSSLTLSGIGVNTVKLVTSNGAFKDSISTTIYNAGVFTGNSNYTISPYDTTICLGSQANLLIGNYNTQLSYATFSNTLQISPWATPVSGNLVLNTNPLNFSDTLLTVNAVSGYSNCPGNSFSKTKKIKVLPLPPSNLMSLVSDSICYNDTVGIILAPCTSKTTYNILMQNNVFINTFTASTGSTYNYTYNNVTTSRDFYYKSTDSNGCILISSPLHHLTVDSLWIKLKTIVPATIVGDTISILNQSVAHDYNWNYSPGTTVVSNNDTVVKLKFASIGNYNMNLLATNLTGCRDSVDYHIGVYNPLNQGSGSSICFSDTTFHPQHKVKPPSLGWYYDLVRYHRFHVDIRENYYVAREYGLNNTAIPSSDDWSAIHFKLSKYDRNGNLKWTVMPDFSNQTIGPIGSVSYIHTTIGSVSSDANGNVFISGNFRGGVLKIGTISKAFNANANGNANAFIAKLDSMGNCKWILAMSKTNNGANYLPATVGKLIADNPNNIYFQADNVGFAAFTNTVVNTGAYYSCLYVIDGNGNLKRMMRIYETNPGQAGICSINGASGNYNHYFFYDYKMIKYKNKLIYYTYTNESTVQLYSGASINAPALPGFNSSALMAFVVVTDTIGNVLNYFKPAVLYDSIQNNPNFYNYSFSREYLPKVNIDKYGNLYFQWSIGTFNAAYEYFDIFKGGEYNKNKYTILLNNNSQVKRTDPVSILVKYDLNGNLIWHKEANYLATSAMEVNNDNNMYGIGHYNRLTAFESADGNNQLVTTTDSCHHMLLYSYDPAGNFLWAKTFNSVTNGQQYPGEIFKKDSCNTNLYFSSGFDTTTNFMNNSYLQTNKLHFFKFSPDGSCSEINCIPTSTTVTSINEATNNKNIFKVIPNPNNGQFTVLSDSNEELLIKVYNSTGQLVTETTLLPGLRHAMPEITASGIYYIIASSKSVMEQQRIMVVR